MAHETQTTPYRVRHEKSGDSYFVLAGSPDEAVEIVTLQLGDAEGAAAWSATSETPGYGLPKGVVLDAAGNRVKPVEA